MPSVEYPIVQYFHNKILLGSQRIGTLIDLLKENPAGNLLPIEMGQPGMEDILHLECAQNPVLDQEVKNTLKAVVQWQHVENHFQEA